MQSRKAYDLIYIGLILRHLTNITESFTSERTINLINTLQDHLKSANLKTSMSGFDFFIIPIAKRLEQIESQLPIGKEEKKNIVANIAKIENIVFSESKVMEFYVIPERRFNGEFLLSKPMNLLKTGVFDKLPDMAKFDFSSACKCLLYGEATASAFHILRATEETLKHFYFKYKKTNRLSKPMWGPMTTELKAKTGKKPTDTILNTLDLVRTSYRNPTQHPESRYDIEEAQDLFGVCIDLINKMGIELDSK